MAGEATFSRPKPSLAKRVLFSTVAVTLFFGAIEGTLRLTGFEAEAGSGDSVSGGVSDNIDRRSDNAQVNAINSS